MNDYQYVSVIEPVSPAIERIKTILFRPFDLGRWFVIGFCAWLAQLGKNGNFRFNINFHRNSSETDFKEMLYHAWQYAQSNLSWIVPVVIIGVILLIILSLVIVWLSSRGQFMFLYCVAENKAEVKKP